MSTVYEPIVIDGVELFHTFRGHNNAVEVYTHQRGNTTYNLFKNKNEDTWQCDWVTSYREETIKLDANSADERAMLAAFAAWLKRL